jgi:hypothetical protein
MKKNYEERLQKLEVGRIYMEENISSINKNLVSLNNKVDNHIFHIEKNSKSANNKYWWMMIGYALSFGAALLAYLTHH